MASIKVPQVQSTNALPGVPVPMRDALDIGVSLITITPEDSVTYGPETVLGYISGLKIDGKAPEDLINVIGGMLRRRKSMTIEWSADAVTLYDNLETLANLSNGMLFTIKFTTKNPYGPLSGTNDSAGQTLTLTRCRVDTHSINITENSTHSMSGKAESWTIEKF